MVKKNALLMLIPFFTSCFFDTSLFDMEMDKAPYTGDELRIDGYYYSDLVYEEYIRVAVFYRDGFCIHTSFVPKTQDTLTNIENEILLNDAYISKLKNSPSHIGVFRIINPDIEFEAWEYRNTTISHFGKIINDTTFVINKRINRRNNAVLTENRTYKFKQFDAKPDSISKYVP